jgi:hypothetical protein
MPAGAGRAGRCRRRAARAGTARASSSVRRRARPRRRVSIEYIDATRIEGSYSLQLRALVPAEGLFNENGRFADAGVTGDFSGTFAPASDLLSGISRSTEVVYDCTPAPGGSAP